MEIRSVKGLKNSPADREGAEMKNLLKILWRQQEGQDLTEYALLLALLALGAITSIGTLAKMINNIFANAASNIGTATGP
jgi:Flp pilus assembly pilin Flp